MKNANLWKLIGAGVLVLTISGAPFTSPAAAQVAESEETYEDEGFNLDWLGLLGLLGLAGLAGKNRKSPTVYRDPNSPGSEY